MDAYMELGQRKKEILEYIVRDYIRTAIPVSSGKISASGSIEASPATIRNCMSELDADGYLLQPHTSAGRIPSEKGYQYFIKHCTEWKDPSRRAQMDLDKAVARREDNIEDAFQEISRALAKHLGLFSGIGVWGDSDRLFTHGLSEVFKSPEFEEHTVALEFAKKIEHLHDSLEKLITIENHVPHYTPEVQIDTFGIVSVSHRSPRGTSYVAFTMGPRRMDYEGAGSMLKYTMEDFINSDDGV